MNYTEDVCVFSKKSPLGQYPLSDYVAEVFAYIAKTAKKQLKKSVSAFVNMHTMQSQFYLTDNATLKIDHKNGLSFIILSKINRIFILTVGLTCQKAKNRNPTY